MSTTSVTHFLERIRAGDAEALERVIPMLYSELHALAQRQLRDERTDHTLNATALVHEAYLKLVQQRELRADDRAQFLGIAANTMRRLLVDYARAKKRQKRGGGATPVPFDDTLPFMTEENADEMLALNDALSRLEAINPRGSLVVQYRFFAGLSLEETADLLSVSVKTVQRAWTASRAWLRKEVRIALLD